MRKELGPVCAWVSEEMLGNETPHIRIIGTDTAAFPIDKVYKRLVNGPEDSVVSFVDVGMAILREKLDLPKGDIVFFRGNHREK